MRPHDLPCRRQMQQPTVRKARVPPDGPIQDGGARLGTEDAGAHKQRPVRRGVRGRADRRAGVPAEGAEDARAEGGELLFPHHRQLPDDRRRTQR